MARRRYIWDAKAIDPRDGTVGCNVEVDQNFQQPPRLHYVRGDTPGYVSPVTGLWIEGARARRNDLRSTGSRPWEGKEQEEREAARRKAYEDQAFDAGLTEEAERALAQMPLDKRRQLGAAD